MNALAFALPLFIAAIWTGLSFVFESGALRAAAVVNANIWIGASMVIGVLQ
jgi:hypothetical protein